MIKRKLVLKKQVIESLSDLEKSKVLGGANDAANMGTQGVSVCVQCETTFTMPCDSDLCSLKSGCCGPQET